MNRRDKEGGENSEARGQYDSSGYLYKYIYL